MKLAGLSVMISGGASGMGAATARAFAAKGAKLSLLDRNLAAAQMVASEIGGHAYAADVTLESEVASALYQIEKQAGAVRIAVNCAGVATPGKILGREGVLPLADFAQVININLLGSFNVMRLVAAQMSAAEPLEDGERGVIINTASVAAYEGQIGQAAYAASKGGIVGLTLPAARELARHGIRVLTIAPGLIDTPLFSGLPPAAVEKLKENTVFPKRLGQPDEFAALALHCAENRLLNGVTIRLDGAVRLS